MENENKFRDDAFVARWISGELSQAERQGFDQWIESNPEEKHYFDELKTVWSDYGSIRLERGLSGEARWDRISERLYLKPESTSETESQSNWFKWGAVAAAAVVVFGFYYLWTSLQMQTIVSPRGSRIAATLPDGSKVSLNAESTIKYREKEWLENREVQLTGEAFFEVIATEAPFLVTTEFATTEVLGTSFNVMARGRLVEVSCVAGEVSIRSNVRDEEPVILTRGLASRVVGHDSPTPPYQFGIDEKAAWRRGELYFQSTPLKSVFEEIARQFDTEITIEASIDNPDFTGRIELNEVTKVLDFVCLTSGLNYRVVDSSTFVIY